MKSGIEIAKRDFPPYLQAKFQIGGKHASKSMKLGENSVAHITQRRIRDDAVVLKYKLDYGEDYAFQIKTWVKTRFVEYVEVCFKDGSVEKVNCRHGKSKRAFKGLTFGINWDRVKILPINENPPTRFKLGGLMLELLKPEQISHVVIYRKRDFRVVEFTFIWKRFKTPMGVYELDVKLIRKHQ